MKKISTYTMVLFLIILLSSCSRRFTTTTYDSIAYKHQTLAILPFEMIFTGRITAELTPEMIEEIEELESKAFQVSLYNMLHTRAVLHKQPIRVSFQHFDSTNDILNKAGISLRDSWQMPPGELAAILGVDAVVKTRVEKARYISDLASFGIYVARDLMRAFSNYIPYQIGRTGDVWLSCSILDGEEGLPVWVFSDWAPAYWYLPADQLINAINRRAAVRFPYREVYY